MPYPPGCWLVFTKDGDFAAGPFFVLDLAQMYKMFDSERYAFRAFVDVEQADFFRDIYKSS